MATRRSNGEGSPRKRPDGRWELQISHGGKRQSLYGKTRAEVLRKKNELNRELGMVVTGTVRELAEAWLANVVARKAPRTKETYERALRIAILPALGAVKLADLTVDRVEAWVATLRLAGLAENTVAGRMQALRGVLAYGVRTRRLSHNVAALVPTPGGERSKVAAPTPEQARALHRAIGADKEYGPILLTMLTLGLRRGEAIGLRWEDVDDPRRNLRVRRQVLWLQGQGLVETGLKTKSSERDLHIPPQLRKAWGKRGEGYIFKSATGGPMWPATVGRRLEKALFKAMLPHLRLHDLRHLAASIAFASGVDPKVIQAQLGHANIGVTMDTYTHLLPKARATASAAAFSYLEGE